MALIAYFKRLLRALLNLPEAARPRRVLVHGGATRLAGRTGERIGRACVARVYDVDETGERPVAGARVRYEAGPAPVRLGADEATAVAVTDADGVATVDVRIARPGAGLVTCALDGHPSSTLGFWLQSDATTFTLHVAAPPAVSAEDASVPIVARAFDHEQQPVSGARLTLDATMWPDETVTGELRETAPGVYEGALTLQRAGEWTLTVQDRLTKVIGRRCLHVQPGPPHTVALVGETNPRTSAPRGMLPLRAQLRDRFANRLDPARLRATAFGRPLTATVFDDEARFTVSYPGYGHVPVRVWDAQSDRALETTIHFPAVALTDPGLVAVGSTFRTDLYGFPAPDRPADHATIEIEYDAARTSFVALRRDAAADPPLRVNATVERPGFLVVTLTSEVPVRAEERPNGIFLASVEWRCEAEGESCFGMVARMSPSTPKTELCVSQKRQMVKTICINIIYEQLNAAARAAGDAAAANIEQIFNSAANVGRCCPAIQVRKHYCNFPRGRAWLDATGGDGTVSSPDEASAIFALPDCKRRKCFNLHMLPVDEPATRGRTQIGAPGHSVLDPGIAVSWPNYAAHEFGHAVGLQDLYTRNPDGTTADPGPVDNIMGGRLGPNLTKEQCETVWDNIDDYTG